MAAYRGGGESYPASNRLSVDARQDGRIRRGYVRGGRSLRSCAAATPCRIVFPTTRSSKKRPSSARSTVLRDPISAISRTRARHDDRWTKGGRSANEVISIC